MWFIYLLRLGDKSLYTGMTKDIEKRLQQHRNGNGSKYVRSRLPCQLVYKEEVESKSEALQREAEIKRWSKEEKEELIVEHN